MDELPGRRCSIAGALDVVGDRWALLVVREVALGAHRFSEILRGTGAPREQLTARPRTSIVHTALVTDARGGTVVEARHTMSIRRRD